MQLSIHALSSRPDALITFIQLGEEMWFPSLAQQLTAGRSIDEYGLCGLVGADVLPVDPSLTTPLSEVQTQMNVVLSASHEIVAEYEALAQLMSLLPGLVLPPRTVVEG